MIIKMKLLTDFQREILMVVAKSDFFRQNFYWCGGTLLSYNYLKHRISEDLDFFSEDLFAKEVLISEFNKLNFERVSFSEKLNRQRFIIKKDQQALRLEFVYFPFKPIGRLQKLKEFNLKVDNLEDLLTNKILAAYERCEPKDIFDIYYGLKDQKFTLKHLLSNVSKKFDVNIDEADLTAKILENVSKLEKIQPLLLKKHDYANEIKDFFTKKTTNYLKNLIL